MVASNYKPNSEIALLNQGHHHHQRQENQILVGQYNNPGKDAPDI